MPFDARLYYPGMLRWRRWCRNGMPVQTLHAQVAGALNHVAAFRRKLVFSKVQQLDLIVSGVSGTRERYRFAFRAGYNAKELVVMVGQARPSNTGGNDPRVDLRYGTLGGSLSTSSAARYPDSDASPSDFPSEFHYSSIRIPLTANTEYEVTLRAIDYARPLYCTAYEVAHEVGLDAATSGIVERGVGVGSPILDLEHEGHAVDGWLLWSRNAAHLMAWSVDDQTAYRAVTSTTWTNVIDGTTTAPSSATPGFRYDLSSMNRQGDPETHVTFAVYAANPSGAGGSNHAVRLYTDGGETLVTIGNINSATPQWYTATGNETPAARKYDIQARIHSGSPTIRVYAAALWVED